MGPSISWSSTTFTGGKPRRGHAAALKDALWHLRGKSGMTTASPSSGGSRKTMEISFSLSCSRKSCQPRPPYFTGGATGTNGSITEQTPIPPEWLGDTVTTLRGLIPIPVGWAPLFLNYPALGAAFRRLIYLIVGADTAERRLLRPFLDGLAFACGSPNPHASDPTSALDSK